MTKRLFLAFSEIEALLVLVLVMAVLCISGCQSNPISAANTPEQKAGALYGTFVIFEEQGAKLVAKPDLDPNLKQVIKSADSKAKSVADSLLIATASYLQIKNDLASGKTTQEKLDIATVNLNNWVTQATPVIQALVAAVGGK